MTNDTEVLIVGGGLMGCSIAYHLSDKKVGVTLLERNAQPGQETTARSGAIIRAHYGVPELVSLAKESNDRFLQFTDEIGKECGFVQCGYVVLVDEIDVPVLKANTAMQKGLGANVSLLRPCDISEIAPSVITDDVALASYEPLGGYANPSKTVTAYATRAAELGAKFRYSTMVDSATRTMSGWKVKLSDGETISCDHVVISTGNWSQKLGARFGAALPVAPVRAQIVVMDRPNGGRHMPVVSDLINLAYFREEGETGMWIGSSDMSDLQEKLDVPEGFNETADTYAIEKASKNAGLRFKNLPGEYPENVQRAFTGLYETTPDWQPIIDSLPGNLHIAVGFSGHGFKLAPSVGEIVTSAVIGDPSRKEVEIFGLSRFTEGRPIKSQNTYQRARFLR
jgi:glycine/D-amino acid oxidase-like deaminating enzyme